MSNKSLRTLLEENREAVLEEGKVLVVSLRDGFCTIEKGLDDAPFMIKVDTFDEKVELSIDEFLEIEK